MCMKIAEHNVNTNSILRKVFFVAGMLALTSLMQAQEHFDSLLMKLDEAIEKSHIYIQKREDRIKLLKDELQRVQPGSQEEYEINNRLFKEYKPYICDSALRFQNRNIEIAILLKDTQREYDSKMQVAFLMGSTGMHKEAVVEFSNFIVFRIFH